MAIKARKEGPTLYVLSNRIKTFGTSMRQGQERFPKIKGRSIANHNEQSWFFFASPNPIVATFSPVRSRCDLVTEHHINSIGAVALPRTMC